MSTRGVHLAGGQGKGGGGSSVDGLLSACPCRQAGSVDSAVRRERLIAVPWSQEVRGIDANAKQSVKGMSHLRRLLLFISFDLLYGFVITSFGKYVNKSVF